MRLTARQAGELARIADRYGPVDVHLAHEQGQAIVVHTGPEYPAVESVIFADGRTSSVLKARRLPMAGEAA